MWILLLPLVHTELPVDAIITVGYMILHSYFFFSFQFFYISVWYPFGSYFFFGYVTLQL